jgi:transmembrane sensor
MSLWARYGERVGGPDELTSRRIERRLLERLEERRAPHARRPTSAKLVVAGLVVAVLLAIGLVVAGRLTPGSEPAWVAISTTTRAQEVSLPRGGALWVGLHSRVELAVSDDAGAVVHLREGEVTLQVGSGEGLRWRVEVDPYAVEAVGTRFRVRRTDDAPEVHVDEGVVRLTGPGQPKDGLLIRAIEPVAAKPVVASDEAPARVDEAARVDVELAPTLDDAAAEPAELDEPEIGSDEPGASALEPRSPPRWVERFREAIAAGDDAAAVASLPAGFPSGREPLSASDYLDAGDALASQREAARADAAYRAACRRARAPACGVATFRRALMAGRGGDNAKAIRLATQYLEDHPEGSLAPEVLARRMRWRVDEADEDAARKDARSYLARWPDGPHEDLARRILGERAGSP